MVGAGNSIVSANSIVKLPQQDANCCSYPKNVFIQWFNMQIHSLNICWNARERERYSGRNKEVGQGKYYTGRNSREYFTYSSILHVI